MNECLIANDDDKPENESYSRFVDSIKMALRSSQNSGQISKEFDMIFRKLLKLIKYSKVKYCQQPQQTEDGIQRQLEEDTDRLATEFIKYSKNVKGDLPEKDGNDSYGNTIDVQGVFFHDICKFINDFDGSSYLSRIHNSLPKTPIKMFRKKSVGKQFFQMSYLRKWGVEGIPEGGNCIYETILLYKFFYKLKKAGLDLKIKLFRYKNIYDIIASFYTNRHAGLILTFQGEDYIVNSGIVINGSRVPVISKLQSVIDGAEKENDIEMSDIFENFKHENMVETDKVIFFDHPKQLISHVEENPTNKKIALYVPIIEGKEPEKVIIKFSKFSIKVGINNYRMTFYLKDNDLSKESKEELLWNILGKLGFVKVKEGINPITDYKREIIEVVFSIIEDKIDTVQLYNTLTGDKKLSLHTIEVGGEPGLMFC